MKDGNGNELDIMPRTLVVSATNEAAARQVARSTEVSRDSSVDNLGTRNLVVDLIANLEVEPRLDNTTKFGSNAGPAVWYLFASPSDSPVTVAFLDGKQTPTIQQAESDFNTLGQSWRIFHDYGCALSDERTAIRSDGE